MVLMLNCHAYIRRGPFASRGDDFYLYGVDNFNDLLRVILPMLPQHHEGILIIHGKPNRRVTGFQSLRRRTTAGLTDYTILRHDSAGAISLPSISPIGLIRPISPIVPPLLNPIKDFTDLKDFNNPLLPLLPKVA